ncbi:PREDICTED: mitochondrial, partial [Prunus dulcis]
LFFSFSLVHQTYSDLIHQSRLFFFQLNEIAAADNFDDDLQQQRPAATRFLQRALRLLQQVVIHQRNSQASEEKERDPQQHHDFPPNYESNWTEADMSAMVSALTQVIGTTEDHHQGTVVQSNPSSISHSIVKEEPDRPQPVQEQEREREREGYAEEGLLALWKGLLPRLMRIPPRQAIVWTVADQVIGLYERLAAWQESMHLV